MVEPMDKLFTNFEVVKSIGRGAFGDVYLCKRKSNNQHVVIKKIIEPSSNSEEKYQEMENEVKCHSKLKHPNILEYYESCVEDNSVLIIMEYASGGNLNDFIRSKRTFMLEMDVLHFFCQLASGVQHIHERGILHRDLKSHNILLDGSRRVVKIGDFGISKILESKTKALTFVGTPCYLSPELCRNMPYNTKSDVWALGCLLYEMLCLKRAFEGETLLPLVNKIIRCKIEPIPVFYSLTMKQLVLSMLNVNPDMRPDIGQVISNPLVFPAMLKICCDLGRV